MRCTTLVRYTNKSFASIKTLRTQRPRLRLSKRMMRSLGNHQQHGSPRHHQPTVTKTGFTMASMASFRRRASAYSKNSLCRIRRMALPLYLPQRQPKSVTEGRTKWRGFFHNNSNSLTQNTLIHKYLRDTRFIMMEPRALKVLLPCSLNKCRGVLGQWHRQK